jgi:hypothetical protein
MLFNRSTTSGHNRFSYMVTYMGALPGAKYTLMRTLGMVINLLGLILTIIFAGIGITNLNQNGFLIIGPLISTILFVFFIKIEVDAVDDHRPIFLLLAIASGIIVEVILFAVSFLNWLDFLLYYLPLLFALISMTICWHYTLSIYKKEKVRFLMGYVGFIALFIGFDYVWIGLLALIPIIIVTFAVVLTILAEQQLISKKLMNYI